MTQIRVKEKVDPLPEGVLAEAWLETESGDRYPLRAHNEEELKAIVWVTEQLTELTEMQNILLANLQHLEG